jgi:hypothetical protein
MGRFHFASFDHPIQVIGVSVFIALWLWAQFTRGPLAKTVARVLWLMALGFALLLAFMFWM